MTGRPYLTPEALRGVAEWLDAKAEAIPDRAISLADLAEWLRAEADTRTRRAHLPATCGALAAHRPVADRPARSSIFL